MYVCMHVSRNLKNKKKIIKNKKENKTILYLKNELQSWSVGMKLGMIPHISLREKKRKYYLPNYTLFYSPQKTKKVCSRRENKNNLFYSFNGLSFMKKQTKK